MSLDQEQRMVSRWLGAEKHAMSIYINSSQLNEMDSWSNTNLQKMYSMSTKWRTSNSNGITINNSNNVRRIIVIEYRNHVRMGGISTEGKQQNVEICKTLHFFGDLLQLLRKVGQCEVIPTSRVLEIQD